MMPMKLRQLWTLETHIDDISPEFVGYACERLMREGAVDVFSIATNAKKRRCGILLRVFCKKKDVKRLATVMMEESGSLGVRVYRCWQYYVERKIVKVKTVYGKIGVKCSYIDGRLLHMKPEYEDAKRAAERFRVPLREVYDKVRMALQKD